MEPAGDRREHPSVLPLQDAKDQLPQWSPPVTGGSTAPAFGQVDGVAVAAMESAAERREHVLNTGGGETMQVPPQWSPRSIGGSLGRRYHAISLRELAAGACDSWVNTSGGNQVPQWSPPLNGGSTPSAGATRRPHPSRNGARR